MNRAPVRIANCSGFYGDRSGAAREMVEGGPIDVLTGDYLAELTLFILWRTRERGGYAAGFLTQLEEVLGTCLDRGIKVVTNAGGLAPAALADQVRTLADRLGLDASVSHIEGDDLMPRLGELGPLPHLDTGEPLGVREPVTANAYLGGWGIAHALDDGADVVICPRVTDASLVVGPAAWWHGWARDDWDRLAGAVASGHVIECGTQATGGNYSGFTEVAELIEPGFPIAEVAHDGSSVITKHPGTPGTVTTGTVTAQLLYEIAEPAYPNPDVTARFDTIEVRQLAPDRVELTGTVGEQPPPHTKLCINLLGGYRNSATLVLTGLDRDAKADLVGRALCARLAADGGVRHVDLRRYPTGPDTEHLRITVQDGDRAKVGRRFFDHVMALGLASYPGFHLDGLPGSGTPYGVFWPTLVPSGAVEQRVATERGRTVIEPTPGGPLPVDGEPGTDPPPVTAWGPTVRLPLGRLVGARSGDKGGNANLGVWARDRAGYDWLRGYLTVERLRELLPEVGILPMRRYKLPRLLALNIVVTGLLGEGVAASTLPDPQAKALGERLRAREVDVPIELMNPLVPTVRGTA